MNASSHVRDFFIHFISVNKEKRMMLEFLPNELIIDVFAYLDVVHLFRAFYGLNSRFNTLIVEHHISLFEYTTYLQRLCFHSLQKRISQELQMNFPSLVSLEIKFSNIRYSSFDFLRSMPNLYRLKFEIYDFCVDGYGSMCLSFNEQI